MDDFNHIQANTRFHRLECLKLAQEAESRDYQGHPKGALSSRVLERAEMYADFVNGPAAETTKDMPVPAAATENMPTHLNDPAALEAL